MAWLEPPFWINDLYCELDRGCIPLVVIAENRYHCNKTLNTTEIRRCGTSLPGTWWLPQRPRPLWTSSSRAPWSWTRLTWTILEILAPVWRHCCRSWVPAPRTCEKLPFDFFFDIFIIVVSLSKFYTFSIFVKRHFMEHFKMPRLIVHKLVQINVFIIMHFLKSY